MEKILALLLTDLVDSTALNARLGDAAMRAVWDRHDRGSRELARRFGGQEVDRSDGFLMVFESASDGAAFAAEYHRLLASFTPRVQARAGLHLGPVSLFETSEEDRALGAKRVEVLGLAKAMVARLMVLAQGGQTLASESVALELAGTERRCTRHGDWRFKGLPEPVPVFECPGDEGPRMPPPDGEKAQQVVRVNGQWVGLAQLPRHLPAERDSFFGRALDLRRLAATFDEGARLVVLHGPGGMGKTRMALRYGWGWLGQYPGGVYFCDLAPAQTADGILHGVARALDMPLGRDPVAQIGHVVAARGRCLLILDNFEQVARFAPRTLGAWMDRSLHARFLVTSREALGLNGEHVVELEPLSADDAVGLFHARARAASNRYDAARVRPETADRLVGLLDRLPLALELAAARTTVLDADQLLARMGQRMQLLSARERLPQRQSTLRTTIEWSWELLTPAERAVLAQLSVFEGGFTLGAAESVVLVEGDAYPATHLVLDLLQSLVAKSLLRREDGGRFSMLSTIQEFAAEKLESAGDAGEACLQRHRGYFGAFDEAAAVADRCADLDNLVAACRRAIVAHDARSAAACLRAAWAGLRLGGPFNVARHMAVLLDGVADPDPASAAVGAWVAASACFAMGDQAEARRHGEKALALCPPDEAAILARIRCKLGEIDTVAGRFDQAAEHLDAALRHLSGLADPWLECQVLNARGAMALDLGRLDDAQRCFEQALALADARGLDHWQGGVLGNLASTLYARGDLAGAERHFQRSLALTESSGDRRWRASAMCNLGLIHFDTGRHAQALVLLEQALQIAQQIALRSLEHNARCVMGLVQQATGDLAAACRDFEAAVEGAAAMGDPRSEGQFRTHLGSALSLLGRFEDARRCLQQGRLLLAPLGDPVALGRLICSLAENEHRSGRAESAQEALDEVRRMLERAGASSPLREDYDRALAVSRG